MQISQQQSRVEGYEYAHSNDHDRRIETNKVSLMRDKVSRPTLRQLDRPVNTPNVNHDEADDHGSQDQLDLLGEHPAKAQPPTRHTTPEIRPEHPKDGHGDELERDSCNHDVCALVLPFSGIGTRGFGAADGLDDERDEVAGAENKGVEFCRDDGGGGAEVDDEAAEEDVEGCGEEDGGDDEGDDLGDEGVAVVRALCGVETGGPAYEFSC